jgi:TonB family protein
VWIVAAVCLLALPMLSLLLPRVPAVGFSVVPVLKSSGLPSAVITVSPTAASFPAPVPRIPWILIVWSIGTLAVLGRLAAGMIRLAWLKQRARPIDTASPVPCLESDRVDMPMTWGVFRPVILLPAGHTAWPAERQRLVLAHELIHVRQRDCLFQLLMQFACALYWFHPLVWLAASQFRKERERACDDGVLELGISGPDYAGHLLELARMFQSSSSPAIAVAMAHQSHLESRLVALLDAKVSRKKLSRQATTMMAIISACLLFPIATVRGQAENGRGRISGAVYDASGAVNPHATVLATNLDTNTKETALADPAGEYSLASIPAGHYMLDVSCPGFKIHRSYVTLKANDQTRLDIIMDLGSVSERVEVIGKKPEALVTRAAVPHRIRVGGLVVAAQLVSKVAPVYPVYAQEKGIEGAVLLEAVISTEGGILSLKVVNSADPDLAKAATNAVQQWRYQPTLLNGEPVEVVTTITVDFRLKP